MNMNAFFESIIDLIIAIKENDLSATKIQVEYLNNNFNIDETDISSLNEMLGFTDLNKHNINDSFFYVLDNLKYLQDVEQTKWKAKVILLIIDYTTSQNSTKIQNFIKNNLNQVNVAYQYNSLIRLCHIIQDYDTLLLLKDSLNNREVS